MPTRTEPKSCVGGRHRAARAPGRPSRRRGCTRAAPRGSSSPKCSLAYASPAAVGVWTTVTKQSSPVRSGHAGAVVVGDRDTAARVVAVDPDAVGGRDVRGSRSRRCRCRISTAPLSGADQHRAERRPAAGRREDHRDHAAAAERGARGRDVAGDLQRRARGRSSFSARRRPRRCSRRRRRASCPSTGRRRSTSSSRRDRSARPRCSRASPATLPVLSTVKVKGALLLSPRRSPKSCDAGSISSAGVMPLPLSATLRGEPGASSTSLSDALAAPSRVGEGDLDRAARGRRRPCVPEQPSAVIANWSAFAPVSVTAPAA